MVSSEVPVLSDEQHDAVVQGGQEITVSYQDPKRPRERVLVRLLPLSQIPVYRRTIDDEAAAIELCCGRPAGWADSLSADSQRAVLELAERLNLDPLADYCDRMRRRMDKMMPQLAGLEEKLALKLAEEQIGRSATSPKSSPNTP